MFEIFFILIVGALCIVGVRNCESLKSEDYRAYKALEREHHRFDPARCEEMMFKVDDYKKMTCGHGYHRLETTESDGEFIGFCRCDLEKEVVKPELRPLPTSVPSAEPEL